ncbi:MAG TPA: 3-methyl-2-oxobutanoate hydroxymethyltransferase [Gemmatimonadaceae bacterium]|nr:3-methyl-2-oxobutanoate hydroxymethyltransferase [Gemmatimonadaceae bacterium]
MPRLTIRELGALKARGERLVALTAYDAPAARLAEQAGVDLLLVGDSVAMVVLGMANTLEVTMDEMIHHCRAVVRGSERAHVVLDMPFMSYQTGDDDAVRNAGRAIKEGGAQSIKLEGGAKIAPVVERLVDIGIPVMGHVGLRPQAVHQVGGFRTQGTDAQSADAVIADAEAIAAAGAYAMVLEKIPAELAEYITGRVSIPTIGIGSGPHCDGQVLVLHDMLGLDSRFHPKHSKRYAALDGVITEAVRAYASEVRAGTFPGAEQAVPASEALRDHLRARAG